MLGNLERIKMMLSELMTIEGVRSVIIASSDGLPIEKISLDKDFDANTISALVSTIKGAGVTLFSEYLGGSIKSVLIEGSTAKILIKPLSKDYLLALILEPQTNLGILNIALSKYLEELKNLVSEA